MLTFEQKQTIIESYPQLTKKEISLKRINYHFENSLYEKTIVVEKLHPNGNGFVFVGDLLKYEKEASDKGLVISALLVFHQLYNLMNSYLIKKSRRKKQ